MIYQAPLFIKITKYLVITLLTLALAVGILPVFISEVQAASVNLVLSPASQTIEAGNNFTMDIQVQCNGTEVSGVETHLDFDPKYLEIERIEAGGVFNTVLQNQYDNQLGTVDYSAGKITAPWPSNTVILTSISFKTRIVSTGVTTQVSFHTAEPRINLVDFLGENIPNNMTGATVIINNPAQTFAPPAPLAPVRTTAQSTYIPPIQTTKPLATSAPNKTTTPANTPGLNYTTTTATPGQNNATLPEPTTASPVLTPPGFTTGRPSTTTTLTLTAVTPTISAFIPISVPATTSSPASSINWNPIVGIIGAVLLVILALLFIFGKRIRK